MTTDSPGRIGPAGKDLPNRGEGRPYNIGLRAAIPRLTRQAMAGAWADRARRFPPVVALGNLPRVIWLYLAVGTGLTGLSALLLWPITGGDYPPGVDTPTFLHLSWVADLAFSGQLENALEDPYWYGGFSYLTYPPLSYSLIGGISAATPINFVSVYNSLLILSYGALGFSVWFLAREFGLRWWSAVIAGLLVIIAYPGLASVFLWGWFTSVMAMPFALVSIALLERSLRRRSRNTALLAGVLMATATLIHHMTSLAMGLGLLPWFGYHLVLGHYSRRQLVVYSLIYGITTVAIIAPWAIPFLMETAEVGFRREIPGNWLPDIATYRSSILDPSLVGDFTYPSYLGIGLTTLALAGIVIALIERQRLAGMALILLAIAWFSMGAKANPLINHYPFSSLDVGRFQLYMTPFMALLAATSVERFLTLIRENWLRVWRPLAWRLVAITVLALILVYPGYTAWRARDLAQPYQIEPQVQQALDWLAATPPDPDGSPPRVFTVGFWNWHSFLVPTLADRPLIDGWHDEGAANVGLILQLRGMTWKTGSEEVDAAVAHQILTTLGADYALLHRSYWRGERAVEFWEQFEEHPDLFTLRESWGDVGVFQILRPTLVVQ